MPYDYYDSGMIDAEYIRDAYEAFLHDSARQHAGNAYEGAALLQGYTTVKDDYYY